MTFPNNLYIKGIIGHGNSFALYYIPYVVLIGLWGMEEFPRVTRSSIARIALASALYALLFSTDVYTAWMFGFTLLVAAATVAVTWRENLPVFMRKHGRAIAVIVTAAVVAFLIALVPFILIYVPVRSFAPLRGYREYIFFAPYPTDIIDVGTNNLLWGWLVFRLLGPRGAEQILAVTPGLTVLFFVLAYQFRSGLKRWQFALVASCAAVWLATWLLTMRIGAGSGFWLMRYVIPGATGIRAGMRVQLIVNLWIVLGLGVLIEHWIGAANKGNSGARRWLVAGVILFCLVEQINVAGSQLRRSEVLTMLANVPQSPSDCRAFLVVRAHGSVNQVDAMWISNQIGLPTLNGSSGWDPPGWQLYLSEKYIDAAKEWAAQNHLHDQICVYDLEERRWSKL
jgi:hypothetical protein